MTQATYTPPAQTQISPYDELLTIATTFEKIPVNSHQSETWWLLAGVVA